MRTDPKVLAGVDGSLGAGRTALILAVVAGLCCGSAAYGYTSSTGVQAVMVDNELIVTGTTGNDNLLVDFVSIAAGSICKGNDQANPPLDPLPDEDMRIIQIYDLNGTGGMEPLFPMTLAQITGLNCNDATTIKAAADAFKNYPDVDKTRFIRFRMDAGNDTVDCTRIPQDTQAKVEFRGGPGNDVFRGGGSDDTIYGDAGGDLLQGGWGNDTLDGGGGGDVEQGGGGDDKFMGGGYSVLDYSDGGTAYIDCSVWDRESSTPCTVNDGFRDASGRRGVDQVFGYYFIIRGSDADDTILGYNDNWYYRNAYQVITTGPNPTTVTVWETLQNTILGGWGDDVIMGSSRVQSAPNPFSFAPTSDIIFGQAGDDVIFGFPASDLGAAMQHVRDGTPGWDGNDYIFGGPGDDTIYGGSQNDVLVGDGVDPPNFMGRFGSTTPVSVILASTATYYPPAPSATGGDDRIFAGPSDTGDFDQVFGCAGRDQIHGDNGLGPPNADGVDYLYGDFGSSLSFGGTWFDTAALTAQNDINGGADRIRGGAGDDFIAGGASNDILSGGDGSDTIRGNLSKVQDANEIRGDDRLIGGEVDSGWNATAQDDSFDFADYRNVILAAGTDGVRLSLAAGTTQSKVAGEPGDGDGQVLPNSNPAVRGTDTFVGIENVWGSPNNDTLIGDDLVPLAAGYYNTLHGQAGNDWLIGGGGPDHLLGEDGNDLLRGDITDRFGDGDLLEGGAGNDMISGQGGADTIRGGSGSNILSGGIGTDTLDYLNNGTGGLVANFRNVDFQADLGGGLTTYVKNSVRFVGSTDVDTIVNCGDAEVGGTPNICTIGTGSADAGVNSYRARFEIVLGSNASDYIVGYDGDENANPLPGVLNPFTGQPNAAYAFTLLGNAGNDQLKAGLSKDYVDGGTGNDFVWPGAGDDFLRGGPSEANPPGVQLGDEQDTISYQEAPVPVTIDLTSTAPQGSGDYGTKTLIEFENLIGTNFDDVLRGNARSNIIEGGPGNDLIAGRGDEPINQNNVIYETTDKLYGGRQTDADGTNPDTDYADYTYGAGAPASAFVYNGEWLVSVTDDGEGGSDELHNIRGAYTPASSLMVNAGPDKIIAPGRSTRLDSVVYGGASANPASDLEYIWDTVPGIKLIPGKQLCEMPVPGLDDRCVPQPNASPQVTTTYKLTVREKYGLKREASDFVVVTVAGLLSVDAGASRVINKGQSVQLAPTVAGGVTPYTYEWTPVEGLDDPTLLRPTASPAETTTYTLTVRDASLQTESDTLTITVQNPFSVTVSATQTVLALGESAQLQAKVFGGTDLTYSWSPAAGLSATNIANPVAKPNQTTNYTVTVTDTPTGRTVEDTITITVVNPSGSEIPAGTGDGTNTGGNTNTGGSTNTGGNGGTGSDDTQAPTGLLPTCGAGSASAMLTMNLMLLVVMARRRWRP